MAKSGSNVVGITVGGNEMKSFLESDVVLNIEALLEETHGFGAAWAEATYTGVKKPADMTLTGWYDEAAGGPNATFAGAEGTTLAVVVTWKSGKTSSFSSILQSYQRTATRGALTKFTAVLRPTGAVTEA